MATTLLFNKPYGVLSQFTDKSTAGSKRQTLSDFIDVPHVYPAGRLDRDSEGLMILTDDGRLQARISNPRHKKWKQYWVQVEGLAEDEKLDAFRKGLRLKDGPTQPARARRIDAPDTLWPRDPPIRVRKSIPDCWLDIALQEGRNRQIRRMTAAIGHPTLRLIRYQIADWQLGDLQPGDWRRI